MNSARSRAIAKLGVTAPMRSVPVDYQGTVQQRLQEGTGDRPLCWPVGGAGRPRTLFPGAASDALSDVGTVRHTALGGRSACSDGSRRGKGRAGYGSRDCDGLATSRRYIFGCNCLPPRCLRRGAVPNRQVSAEVSDQGLRQSESRAAMGCALRAMVQPRTPVQRYPLRHPGAASCRTG